MIGEPITYRIVADDVVSMALIFSAMLVGVGMMIIGKPFWRKLGQLPLFNYRQNDKSVTETPGLIQPVLLLQATMSIALMLFAISVHMNTPMAEPALPSMIMLLSYMGVAALYITFCWMFYRFVIWMFLDAELLPLITEAWINSVCFEGVLLLPIAAIGIYYKLPMYLYAIYIVLAAFLPRYLLYYWLRPLFYLNFYGRLLFILYFCALQVFPLVLVMVGTEQLNRYLLFNY